MISLSGVYAKADNSFDEIQNNSAARKVTSSGELKIYYIDNFSEDKETILYKIEINNHTKKAIFAPTLTKIKENTFIDFKAYELDGVLYIYDYTKKPHARFSKLEGNISSDDHLGTHKLLVVRVNDAKYPVSYYGYTDSEIRKFYSEGENNLVDFYREASNGKFNLEVEYVAGGISVNNLCSSSTYTPFDQDTYKNAVYELEEKYGSLEDISFISFITATGQNCFYDGILGVASLGKEYFNLSTGSKRLAINFINSTRLSSYDLTTPEFTIFHEFGHNLGLHHDNAHVCGKSVFTSSCDSLEYGGAHSIMGYSPSLAHPNTTYKEKLSWLDNNEAININQNSFLNTIELYPVSSTAEGTKLIKIDRGDGKSYNIEFRKPIGYDAKIMPRRNYSSTGFLIYYEDPNLTNTILMDASLLDRRASMGSSYDGKYANSYQALQSHERALAKSFDDPVNKIHLEASNLDSLTEPARIVIAKNLSQHPNLFQAIATQINIKTSEINGSQVVTTIIPFKQYSFELLFNNASLKTYISENIKEVLWDFNDDGVYEKSTGLNNSTKGSFIGKNHEIVRAKIIDQKGNETIISQSINSLPNPLSSSVGLNIQGGNIPYNSIASDDFDLAVFHKYSLGLEYADARFNNNDISITGEFEWDFEGDGTYDLSTTTDHTYFIPKKSGTYNVTIRYTDVNTNQKTTKRLKTITVVDDEFKILSILSNKNKVTDYSINFSEDLAINYEITFTSNLKEFQNLARLKTEAKVQTGPGSYYIFNNIFNPKVIRNQKNKNLYKLVLNIPPYKVLRNKYPYIFEGESLDNKDMNLSFISKISKRSYIYSKINIPLIFNITD